MRRREQLPPPFNTWSSPFNIPRFLSRQLTLTSKNTHRELPLLASERLVARMRAGLTDKDLSALDRTCAGLEGFAWALFQLWLDTGGPDSGRWVFRELPKVAGDETVRRLDGLIKVWVREKRHSLCAQAIEVMRKIASPTALLYLETLSRKNRDWSVRKEASDALSRLADDRGCTREGLVERLVPDLGLDHGGQRRLDLGPRSLSVQIDAALSPALFDEEGRSLGQFPPARRRDDPQLYLRAKGDFRLFKKEAQMVASIHLERFERAMERETCWGREDFLEGVARHRLLRHLAHRMVWGLVEGGELVRLFRVAEDGTFTDVDDRELELPQGAQVTLPHALRMGGELDRWRALFFDYKLLQPLVQLEREVHRWPEDQLDSNLLTFCEGWDVPPTRLLRLKERGWREHFSGPSVGSLTRPQGRYCVRLSFSPGYRYKELKGSKPVTLSPLQLIEVKRSRSLKRQRQQLEEDRPWFSELDDLSRSELLRDLESLRG